MEPVEPTNDLAPVRQATPPSIQIALLLFVFAISCPFIGAIVADRSHGDGWHSIGVMFQWLLAGAAATIVAIISTIIGAFRAPRSGLTILAIVLASLGGVLFLVLLGVMLR